MRLLHTTDLKLKEFFGPNIPPYVILSHTWGDEEVLFNDIQAGVSINKKGFKRSKKAVLKHLRTISNGSG